MCSRFFVEFCRTEGERERVRRRRPVTFFGGAACVRDRCVDELDSRVPIEENHPGFGWVPIGVREERRSKGRRATKKSVGSVLEADIGSMRLHQVIEWFLFEENEHIAS